MGEEATAYLRYGYLLGHESEWHLKGDLPIWLQDGDDLPEEEAQDRLLKSVGFLETDFNADGFFKRRNAALAEIGVEIAFAGSFDAPEYALVLREPMAQALWGWKVIDLPRIDEVAAVDLLDTALQTLDLETTFESPSWLIGALNE